jgi:hypothetical protein
LKKIKTIKHYFSLPLLFGITKFHLELLKNALNKNNVFEINEKVVLLYLINIPISNGKYLIVKYNSPILEKYLKDVHFKSHLDYPISFDFTMFYKNIYYLRNKSKLTIKIFDKYWCKKSIENMKWIIVNEIDDIIIESKYYISFDNVRENLNLIFSWIKKKISINIAYLYFIGLLDLSHINHPKLVLFINSNNFIKLPYKMFFLYIYITKNIYRKIIQNIHYPFELIF